MKQLSFLFFVAFVVLINLSGCDGASKDGEKRAGNVPLTKKSDKDVEQAAMKTNDKSVIATIQPKQDVPMPEQRVSPEALSLLLAAVAQAPHAKGRKVAASELRQAVNRSPQDLKNLAPIIKALKGEDAVLGRVASDSLTSWPPDSMFILDDGEDRPVAAVVRQLLQERKLTGNLQGEDYQRAFRRLGVLAVQPLVIALNSSSLVSLENHRAAAEALKHLGPIAQKALPALDKARQRTKRNNGRWDEYDPILAEAYEEIQKSERRPAPLSEVLAGLKSNDPSVRQDSLHLLNYEFVSFGSEKHAILWKDLQLVMPTIIDEVLIHWKDYGSNGEDSASTFHLLMLEMRLDTPEVRGFLNEVLRTSAMSDFPERIIMAAAQERARKLQPRWENYQRMRESSMGIIPTKRRP